MPLPPEKQVSSTLFHLHNEQKPYHPGLTAEVIRLVGDQIDCRPFEGLRMATGEPLVYISTPTDLAMLMESYAPYMTYRDGRENDLIDTMRRMETSGQSIQGLLTMILYFEMRDDREKFRPGDPYAKILAERFANEDVGGKVVAISTWEPHSVLGLNIIHEAFQKKQGREIAIFPLTAMRLFAQHFREKMRDKDPKKCFVVAPDLGSIHRAMLIATELGLPIIFTDKDRPRPGEVEIHGLYMADPETGLAVKVEPSLLERATIFMGDDSLATTGTIVGLSRLLKKGASDDGYGVNEIHIGVTHAVYIHPEADDDFGNALEEGIIDSALITDTLPSCNDIRHKNLRVLSVAEPTALLLKAAAGVATDEERKTLELYYFNPGPSKEEVEELFKNGQLSLRPEEWPYSHVPKGIPPEGVLFYRTEPDLPVEVTASASIL